MSLLTACRDNREGMAPPLESADYSRYTTSAEISTYMKRLAGEYPEARVEILGATVEGRPIEALLLSTAPSDNGSASDRLTVMIVGGQHGAAEAGTAESLLFIARELLAGKLRPVLEDVDVVLVPNVNSDGREVGTRNNVNGINLNTDFVTLTQPENQALLTALERYRPEVVLDVHESAILKRKSLGLEGYMTDFWAQFETANNPSIIQGLRRFALDEVLTPWIDAVNDAGLKAHRYIAEIRSPRQPATNGGLTLNNFRNRCGIENILSFLMETRLDPRDGVYPTYRNIRWRVEAQRLSIEQFLTLLDAKRADVLAAISIARAEATSAPLVLEAQYVAAPGNPTIPIQLRRISDGVLETIEFPDHRTVVESEPLPLPAAYVARAHQNEIRAVLDRHKIAYRIVEAPLEVDAIQFDAEPDAPTLDAKLANVRERTTNLAAQPGDLWIDLAQPRGRLAAMLLEPLSNSSLWRKPEYSLLIASETVLPIYRIPRGATEPVGPDS